MVRPPSGGRAPGRARARTFRCRPSCASRSRRRGAHRRVPGRSRDRSKPPMMPSDCERLEHGRDRPVELQHRLVEARPGKGRAHAGQLPERRDEIVGARDAGARDARKARGPEERKVDRRGRHQESLVGADVRSRLGAADVLLARLQRQREAGRALGIDRATGDAPRHLAHVLHAAGHEADVGAARGQRHAKGLRIAAGDVGAAVAPFARRCEERERHRIHGRDDERAVRARPARERIHILELAEEIRLRDHDRGDVLAGELPPATSDRCARSPRRKARRRASGPVLP